MKRMNIWLIIPVLCLLAGCGKDPVPTTHPSAETIQVTQETILTGWQTIDGDTYCFLPDGTMLTGWVNDNGHRYFLGDDGKMRTGWQEIDGKRFYFDQEGVLAAGWRELEGETYYFGVDGSLITGLMNIEGKGYFFTEAGARYSGWLTLEENTYYFDEQGVMAVGPAQIDGKTHYFSPHGVCIPLVNRWNPLSANYTVELVNVTERDRLETACAEALVRMLADCEAAGHKTFIVSAYRTREEQEFLYNRKLNVYLEMGWELTAAQKEAAKNVALPDTSEHQLGLAVDISDADYMALDDTQADTATQQWLMEHCHEYGFILRYPTGTTEITGIVFEPWHYRYVGVDIAREITNLGITLEEYLGAV